MLPIVSPITDDTAISEPSKTFYINFDTNRIEGKIDGLKAIEQAIILMLTTERYAELIFSWDYGAGLEKYIGKSFDYITGDINREITDALLTDDRIKKVYNFQYTKNADEIAINFTVDTIYGSSDMGVSI